MRRPDQALTLRKGLIEVRTSPPLRADDHGHRIIQIGGEVDDGCIEYDQ